VDEGIGQRFTLGFSWQCRGVNAGHLAGHDFADHGHPVNEKALGPAHECEGVACVLAFVEKLVARAALE
jgi:hypothetical protein